SAACPEDCSDRHQWIELRNRTALPVDVSGWSLDKGVRMNLPAGTQIPPGGYIVCVASQATFAKDHPGVAAVAGEWSGKLASHEDTIQLRDALGNLADSVHYGNGDPFNDTDDDGNDDRNFISSDWPAEAEDSGRSIELIHEHLRGSSGRAWRLGPVGGTPGATNAKHEDDPPPVVASVTHSPAVPDSLSSVSVTCNVSAAQSIDSVEVHWKLDDQATLHNVPLLDDGASGDGDAGDGVYGGVIPAQADGSIVAFQIVATTAQGGSDTYPLMPPASQRKPYYLYEVDDAAPLANGSPDFRVILASADLEALKSRSLQSNVLLPCTFIGNGTVRHLAGLRYRGENSRNLARKSYRLEFPPERTFQGVEHLNLNASNGGGGEPTTSVRDFLASDLFRRAGLPYPMVWPVNLHFAGGVNGNLQGRPDDDPFFIAKEHFGRDFLARFFGAADGGNLYRPIDPGGGSGDLSYRGPDPGSYAPVYEKRSNRNENDYSDLVELTAAFDRGETPDAAFEDEMRRLIDVEEWARFFAIQDYISNIDGGIWTNSGEDYFLYRVPAGAARPDAGLWLILPWDLEETFSDPNAGFFLPAVDAARRFIRNPAFAPRYLAHWTEIVKGAASPPQIEPRYSYVESIYPAAAGANLRGALDAYVLRRAEVASTQIRTGIEAAIKTVSAQGTPLISEGDSWAYFKGRREPSAAPLGWTRGTFNDSAWARGPSGIGYGDGDDATTLDDMRAGGGEQGYFSVYARKTFNVTEPQSLSGLTLIMDYDDAFVAYLNGVEVARSPNLNSASARDEPIPFDLELGDSENHEASRGNNSPNPPESFPIDNFADLLQPGENVLAVQGFNSTLDSSDFSLIPELRALAGPEASSGGWGTELFVSGATAALEGWASGAAAFVEVNGAPASITQRPPSGGQPYGLLWTANVPVNSGANRVRIESFTGLSGDLPRLDTSEIVVWRIDRGFVKVSGSVAGAVEWTEAGGPYLVSASLRVPAGGRLTMQPGAQVLIARGASITVEGTLEINGTPEDPVHIQPTALDQRFGGIVLSATGTSDASPLHVVRGAAIERGGAPTGAAGCIVVRGARLHVEDSTFLDLGAAGIDAQDSRVEVARTTFERCRGGLAARGSDVTITDSTFEDAGRGGNALSLRGNLSGRSRLEVCTVESADDHAVVLRDASVDVLSCRIGGAAGSACRVEGSGSWGRTAIEGCVLHDAAVGLDVSGSGEPASAAHDTIAWCSTGVSLVASGGILAELHSMILWENRVDAITSDGATLTLSWSDIASGVWPGPGNISADPRLTDPYAGNFSLAAGSPCRGTGKDGTDMGATGRSGGGAQFLRGEVTGE
ncbi:MAG TPA: CotH kinase family protein, partial [Planctomycetota bacterium]|nr:CotH kinase family protein [Planctomycetota bacterium]